MAPKPISLAWDRVSLIQVCKLATKYHHHNLPRSCQRHKNLHSSKVRDDAKLVSSFHALESKVACVKKEASCVKCSSTKWALVVTHLLVASLLLYTATSKNHSSCYVPWWPELALHPFLRFLRLIKRVSTEVIIGKRCMGSPWKAGNQEGGLG